MYFHSNLIKKLQTNEKALIQTNKNTKNTSEGVTNLLRFAVVIV